ncbi:MAG: YchJ family protein [Kofleriaceae bacterium]
MVTATDDRPCPCDLGRREAVCCGPIVAGAVAAPTAVALMRSRYVGYVRGAVDHLVRTHAAAGRAALDVAALARWTRATAWLGLEIVATSAGGVDDATGTVEFIARGVAAGAPFAQRERSRFAREAGAWVYVDGDVVPTPAPPPGRNAPCPCGSGRKLKRCHGAAG